MPSCCIASVTACASFGAAAADQQLVVSKQTQDDGRTASAVKPVSGDARAREIARMLGGVDAEDTSLAHARALLSSAAAAAAARLDAERRAAGADDLAGDSGIGVAGGGASAGGEAVAAGAQQTAGTTGRARRGGGAKERTR